LTAAVVVGFLGSPLVTSIGSAVAPGISLLDAAAPQGVPTPSVKGPIKTVIIPVDPAPSPAPPPLTGTKPVAPAAGASFRDDFEKPPLDAAAWRVEAEDKDRWTIERSHLLIISQASKAATEKEPEGIRNRVVLVRDLPADYRVTTRLSIELIRADTRAGLRVRTTSGSVTLGYKGYFVPFEGPSRAPFLEKRLGAQPSLITFNGNWDEGKPTQVNFGGPARKPETLWFRLEKKGSSFTGEFSMDGVNFVRIGQQSLIGTEGSRLELLAYDESPGVETGVQFDFVEITP
jgi:hypothetical protein